MDTLIVVSSCLVGLVLAAVFGYSSYKSLRNNLRGRSEHIRLAEKAGHELLMKGGNNAQNVYGGVANGRRFAYRLIKDVHRWHGAERSQNVGVLKIQLLAQLDNPQFAGFKLLKKSHVKDVPETFDALWTAKPSADILPLKTQEALFEFSAVNAHEAGFTDGGMNYSFRERVRKVSILDRKMWESPLMKEVFPDAVALIGYDHDEAIFELDEFLALIDEFTQLANKVDA